VLGTGWPEPDGFLPQEALKFMQIVAREGLCGMEVVEVSSPYDLSDTMALLGVRAIADVLATLGTSARGSASKIKLCKGTTRIFFRHTGRSAARGSSQTPPGSTRRILGRQPAASAFGLGVSWERFGAEEGR
jgi:Arginase family